MPRNRRPAVEALEDRCVPTTAQYVTALYADFLNRAPTQAELTSFVNLVNSGTSPTTVATVFANSDEFHDLETRRNYESLLGREPSAAELLAWRSLRQAGVSGRQEAAGFLASDEYFSRQGGTPQGWLNGAFRDVLGRAPDATEQAAFLPLSLASLGVRQQVATTIVSGSEANMRVVEADFALLLGRVPDTAGLNFWTGQLNGGLPAAQMLADLAGSPEFIITNAGSLDVNVAGVPAVATGTTTTPFSATQFVTTTTIPTAPVSPTIATTQLPFTGVSTGSVVTGFTAPGFPTFGLTPAAGFTPFMPAFTTFVVNPTTGFTTFGSMPVFGVTPFGVSPFAGSLLG